MLRSACSALLALMCVSSVTALAQSSGTGAVTVTVTPPANPTPSGLPVTSTVQAVAGASATSLAHPSGTVTLFDGTTALNPGGAAITAGPGSTASTFAQFFGTPDPALTANNSQPAGVVGDFNEDGTLDLLLYGVSVPAQNMTQIQVFASAPGGKFAALPLQNLSIPGNLTSTTPAVLDVNGDGHLDLLFGNMVAYGKGDGTFGTPATLPILASGFSQTYAVDVTGDGKLDIVAVNTPPDPSKATGSIQYTFTVFRNDGSGTFTSLGSFPLATPLPQGSYVLLNIFGLSFADLNGDGKIDVVSQSNGVFAGNAASDVNVYSLLNNGDGTFRAPTAIDTSATLSLGYDPAAFGDLNGDGKTDLVLSYPQYGQRYFIGAALGNGDGTFGPIQQLSLDPTLISTNGSPSVQLGDYNVDGKIDAVVGTGQLALGNGDGTFSLSSPLFSPANSAAPALYPLLHAAFLPGSLPSFVFLNLTSGANAVFTPVDASSVTTNLTLSAGMHSLTAHYSGDANYAATVSPAVPLQITQAATSLTLTSSANEITAGQSVTFTATLSGGTAAASGTITFYDAYPGSNPLNPILNPSSTVIGTVAIANGVAALSTSQLPSGYHSITAQYSGDANNAAGTAQLHQQVDLPFSVSNSGGTVPSLTVKAGQSVSTSFTVSAVGGFTGPVSFSCYGLPAECSFSPSNTSVGGTTATTVTMTITATTPPSTSALRMRAAPTVLACGVPMLALLALFPAARRKSLLSLALLILCGVFGMGCGGSSKPSSAANTTPGNYAFYVIATSGQSATAINYSLTVQ